MRLTEVPAPGSDLSHLLRPIDHVALTGAADAPALATRAVQMDYAALESATGRLAAWLRAKCPVPGTRVASWLPKGVISSLLPLAAPRAGLVHVPVNPLLKHAQLAHILADSGAELLVLPQVRAGQLGDGDVPGGCALALEAEAMEAIGAGDGLSPSDAAPDDLAAILYTSGSTGRPKGVVLSHANLWLGALSVAHYLNIGPQDRTLCVLPFSFDYGQNQLFSTWAGGGCVAPLDYLTPRDVVKAVEREGITTLAGVPPLWVQLVEIDWPQETAAKLKRLTNSGGALTRRLVGQMRETFSQADIYPMYGLTEAFRSTYLPPELVAEFPESMGRAIPFAEIMVIGVDGEQAADGEPGELVHCGPLVAQGYWRDAERTA